MENGLHIILNVVNLYDKKRHIVVMRKTQIANDLIFVLARRLLVSINSIVLYKSNTMTRVFESHESINTSSVIYMYIDTDEVNPSRYTWYLKYKHYYERFVKNIFK